MGRNSFVLYNRYSQYIDMLSDTELAQVIRSVFSYVCTGQADLPKSRTAKAVYALIKEQIDFDNEKYKKTVERNQNNGKKHISVTELRKKAENTVSLYNDICENFPMAEQFSEEKAARFYKALGKTTEEEFFQAVQNSDFLSGKKKNNKYTFSLDWLTEPENVEKILSGKYA